MPLNMERTEVLLIACGALAVILLSVLCTIMTLLSFLISKINRLASILKREESEERISLVGQASPSPNALPSTSKTEAKPKKGAMKRVPSTDEDIENGDA